MKDIHPLWHHPVYKPFPILTCFAPLFKKRFALWRTPEEQAEHDRLFLANNPEYDQLLTNDQQREGNQGHKKAHLKKKKVNKKKHVHNEEAVKDDPLVSLGFGVCAYRDILWSFLWTFVIFSLMLIP
jgi:hypothetical protein